MVKILRKIIITVLCVCCLFSVVGCSNSDTVKVMFRQSGHAVVIREVKKGESLLNVPNPVQEDGYEIVWDKTDFTNLQENLTVEAIKTPKKYTITYDLGSRKDDDFASIQDDEQIVTFGEIIITYKPTCSGYKFTGWEIQGKDQTFTDGKYAYAEDLTLVAMWQVSDNDEDRFSPTIK